MCLRLRSADDMRCATLHRTSRICKHHNIPHQRARNGAFYENRFLPLADAENDPLRRYTLARAPLLLRHQRLIDALILLHHMHGAEALLNHGATHRWIKVIQLA